LRRAILDVCEYLFRQAAVSPCWTFVQLATSTDGAARELVTMSRPCARDPPPADDMDFAITWGAATAKSRANGMDVSINQKLYKMDLHY
jgi:hypothetical protein